MKLNVGTWDRVLRVALGVVLISMFVFGVLNIGTGLGIVAAVAAGVFIISGTVSFCPAYSLFGLRTRSEDS